MRRSLALVGFLTASVAPNRAPARAEAAPVLNAPRSESAPERPPVRLKLPLWSFAVASPVTAPVAVLPGGEVAFASSDGYVHLLGPHGGFRWSYTVKGIPIGSPGVDGRGRIYVATSERRVYALTQAGTLMWLHRVPVDIKSEVRWHPRGFAFFVGADEHIWAVSPRAGVLWRLRLPAERSTQVEVLPNERFIVGSERGLVEFGFGTPRVLGDAGRRVASFAQYRGQVASVVGEELSWHSATGAALLTWSGAVMASVERFGLVAVGGDGQVRWWSPQGKLTAQQPLGVFPSAALAVDAAGGVYVPTSDGRLLMLGSEGGPVRSGQVGRGLVHAPKVDHRRRQVIATTATGELSAFSLLGASR